MVKLGDRRVALLLLAGVLLVGIAGYLWWRPGPRVALRPPAPLISPQFPTPGTASLAGYRVVSADLKIDLPLVDGDGWSVPFYTAALYPGMKPPGDGDRSMLYAHARQGMFATLANAHVGEKVDVVRPHRATVHYVIKQVFLKWSPSDLTYTLPLGHDELVLLTCTSYQANDPRILAVAEPV